MEVQKAIYNTRTYVLSPVRLETIACYKAKSPSDFISKCYQLTYGAKTYNLTQKLTNYINEHGWQSNLQTKINIVKHHINNVTKAKKYDKLVGYLADLHDLEIQSQWTKKDSSLITKKDAHSLLIFLESEFKAEAHKYRTVFNAFLLPQLEKLLNIETHASIKSNILSQAVKYVKAHLVLKRTMGVHYRKVKHSSTLIDSYKNDINYQRLTKYLKYAIKQAETEKRVTPI